jgi:hypothetical protein
MRRISGGLGLLMLPLTAYEDPRWGIRWPLSDQEPVPGKFLKERISHAAHRMGGRSMDQLN